MSHIKLSDNVWATPIACNDEVLVNVDHDGQHTVKVAMVLGRAELVAMLEALDAAQRDAAVSA